MSAGAAPTRLLADRRSLLKGAGAGLATLIAPGVTLYAFGADDVGARPAGEPASTKVRWGLLINSNKCAAGCDRCVTACRDENGWNEHRPPRIRFAMDPQGHACAIPRAARRVPRR